MKFVGLHSFLKFFFILLSCSLSCNCHAGTGYLNVLAFGDSITQGYARDAEGYEYGILEPPRGARVEKWGYEIHLETMIEGTFGSGTSSIYNWGYHGLRSDEALRCDEDWDCIDDVLLSRDADMILIMLGANDLYNGISHTATKFNLSAMIDKSVAQNVEPILGTITPNTSDSPLVESSWVNDHYNPLIRELAQEKNVLLADHYKAMVAEWDLIFTSGDGLHLNDDGNYKLADTWYETIVQSDFFLNFQPFKISPILHLLLLSE